MSEEREATTEDAGGPTLPSPAATNAEPLDTQTEPRATAEAAHPQDDSKGEAREGGGEGDDGEGSDRTDDGEGSDRTDDDPLLPPGLEDFLVRYPHPAFALRASSIFDALVVRANQFAPNAKEAFSHSHSGSGSSHHGSHGQGQGHHSSQDHSHGSHGQGNASHHPAEEHERAQQRYKIQRLSSQEQYEGGITEEERIEREQDERDEQRRNDEQEQLRRNPQSDDVDSHAVDTGADGGDDDALSEFASPRSSARPSLVGTPGLEMDNETHDFPPSVSGSATPTVATTKSAGPGRAADIGPHPRTHARAERILADTFSDNTPAYGRRHSGEAGEPLDRGALLEGGAQKNHDPSRTAEGAVQAMHEQRAQQARTAEELDERAARDEADYERARNREDERYQEETNAGARVRQRSSDRGSSRPTSSKKASDRNVVLAGAAPEGAERADEGQPRPRKPRMARRKRSGPAVGLRDMLTPVWRNSKWTELMAIREDAKKPPRQPAAESPDRQEGDGSRTGSLSGTETPDELELLEVLSRTDAQECLAMLSSVVETILPSNADERARQAETPLARLNHTVVVEINFPESSLYRHPPGSSFHHEHTSADSFASDVMSAGSSLFFSREVTAAQQARRDASSPSAETSDGSSPSKPTRPAEDPASAIGSVIPANSGPAKPPPSNQNPAVPPQHHGIQQESRLLRPFLQVVATLYEEYDLVICTTISGNIPLPVTVTGSPESEDTAETKRSKAAAEERASERRSREQASRLREKEQFADEHVDEQRRRENEVRDPTPAATPPLEAGLAPDNTAPISSDDASGPLPADQWAERSSGGDVAGASESRPSPRRAPSSRSKASEPGAESSRPKAHRAPSSDETSRPSDSQKWANGGGERDRGEASQGPDQFSEQQKPQPRPRLVQRQSDSSTFSSDPSTDTPTLTGKGRRESGGGDSGGFSASPSPMPMESPSALPADLKALLSPDAEPSEPFEVVHEDEKRAAARRMGISHHATRREIDNAYRERKQARRLERQRRKEGERPEHRSKRDGEQKSAAHGDKMAQVREEDERGGTSGSNHDTDDSERSDQEVLGFDEEDDDEDLDRLRRQTRTGSTSSDGSAQEHKEARAQAQLVQDQHDEDEDKREIRHELENRDRDDADSAIAETNGGRSPPHRPSPSRRGRVSSYPQPFDPDAHVSSPPIDHSSRLSEAQSDDRRVSQSSAQPAPAGSAGDPFIDVLRTTDCGRTILKIDWSRSCLGPLDRWTPELRSHVMATLSSPFHTALWYGEDSVLLYNDAYARLLGAKHPAAMGRQGSQGWAEVWDVIGPLASQVMLGKTMFFQDQAYCIYRNGMLEETYMTWAYVTLRDGRGRILGYTNPSFETTARVIAERRLGTLRELSQLTQLSRTSSDFFSKALRALSTNPLDIPFAMLYDCETLGLSPGMGTNRSTSTASSSVSGRQNSSAQPLASGADTGSSAADAATARIKLTLQGTVGVPRGHSSAPEEVVCLIDNGDAQDLPPRSSASSASSADRESSSSTNRETASSTVWPLVEVLQSRKPVFVSDLGKRSEGFTHRGWPDPVRRAVVIPVLVEGSNSPKAVLIIGLNSRRPWNQVYSVFLNLITRTLSTGLLGINVAEEQARKSKELSDLNDARQAFFANVSHELRTPLTLILGPLEDVLGRKNSGLARNDRGKLETVLRNSHRLLNMVNTLLDFSRLESGRMNAKYRPTRLGPRVGELAGLFQSAIERGGIRYNVDIPDDKWADEKPFYIADEMLEKVCMNLISNAFKYCLEGTITVAVRFTSRQGFISIRDTGVGIKDEELSKIFERFHRVESSARSFEGTGIGLSLVFELVKALGGTIAVDSQYGKGSTFTVRLPRGRDHLSPEDVLEEPAETMPLPPRAGQSISLIQDAASWRTQPETERNGEGRTHPVVGDEGEVVQGRAELKRKVSDGDEIPPAVFELKKSDTVCLIVDDNAQLRSFIGELLSKNFTTAEAANGQEALEYARTHHVSIVLTDIAMPIMNGRELLSALKEDPETSFIPVIFLSAQAGSEARVDALLLGADDYITKPFQARELVARVWTHLQIGEMRRELERRVTERTAALIESEKNYRQLADQHQTLALVSPVGIFQTDSAGKVVFTNPRFHEISGHPRDKPPDEWQELVHDDDRERVRDAWTAAVRDWRPGAQVNTLEFRFSGGKWAQLELRSFEKGFIGAITDISHQKEVEADHVKVVEQRAHDAEENKRQTELFLDMSSHELRNPLSGVWQNAEVVSSSLEKISNWLEELKQVDSLDQSVLKEMHDEMIENLDAIESIQICASHQTRIADDILNVSKLNMGLLTINTSPFDLVGAVQEVVRTFGTSAQQQEIELDIDRGESLKRLDVDFIVADPGRVKQVLYNFLTNALKYTKVAAVKHVTVHVDAYDSAPPEPPNAMRVAAPNQSFEPPPGCIWCMVGVEDSGKGLTSDELNLLFQRFVQANPRSDQYGGSGLGLYVSKKLIELHQGFIEVASVPGKGSTFRFAIPSQRVPRPPPSELKEDSADSGARFHGPGRPVNSSESAASLSQPSSTGAPALLSSSPSSNDVPAADLPPLRILLVEDNLINQKVMVRQLKQQGLEVTTANDGQQALDALEEDYKKMKENTDPSDYNMIRVCLMDIEMPVMDGLTAIRELRRREKEGELEHHYPVCAVTGNARDAQKTECLDAGFDDVTVKPYVLQKLLRQISTLSGFPLSTSK